MTDASIPPTPARPPSAAGAPGAPAGASPPGQVRGGDELPE
ncbi:MAG: hypothetical protein QOD57_943, partial [Actinomycetota bacterium]|nr:hypothetical protein [Actinomycetota bacterium]